MQFASTNALYEESLAARLHRETFLGVLRSTAQSPTISGTIAPGAVVGSTIGGVRISGIDTPGRALVQSNRIILRPHNLGYGALHVGMEPILRRNGAVFAVVLEGGDRQQNNVLTAGLYPNDKLTNPAAGHAAVIDDFASSCSRHGSTTRRGFEYDDLSHLFTPILFVIAMRDSGAIIYSAGVGGARNINPGGLEIVGFDNRYLGEALYPLIMFGGVGYAWEIPNVYAGTVAAWSDRWLSAVHADDFSLRSGQLAGTTQDKGGATWTGSANLVQESSVGVRNIGAGLATAQIVSSTPKRWMLIRLCTGSGARVLDMDLGRRDANNRVSIRFTGEPLARLYQYAAGVYDAPYQTGASGYGLPADRGPNNPVELLIYIDEQWRVRAWMDGLEVIPLTATTVGLAPTEATYTLGLEGAIWISSIEVHPQNLPIPSEIPFSPTMPSEHSLILAQDDYNAANGPLVGRATPIGGRVWQDRDQGAVTHQIVSNAVQSSASAPVESVLSGLPVYGGELTLEADVIPASDTFTTGSTFAGVGAQESFRTIGACVFANPSQGPNSTEIEIVDLGGNPAAEGGSIFVRVALGDGVIAEAAGRIKQLTRANRIAVWYKGEPILTKTITADTGRDPINPQYGVILHRDGDSPGTGRTRIDNFTLRGVAEFYATADLSNAGATLSASGIMAAFVSTAQLSMDSAILNAAGTRSLPVFEATASLIMDSATLSSSATHIAFVGSATLEMSSATLTASGNSTPPTYTAIGALEMPSAILSSSGTHIAYLATATLTMDSATLSASGSHTPPTYTASSQLSMASGILSASAISVQYIGSASLSNASATLNAAGTYQSATIDGSGTLSLDAATLSASGVVIGFVSTAELIMVSGVLSGAGNSTPPMFAGQSLLESSPAILGASGTVIGYVGTSSLINAVMQLSSSGNFIAPIFASTASLVSAAATLSASGNATPPVMTGTASLTMPSAVLSAVGMTFVITQLSGTGTLRPLYTVNATLRPFLTGKAKVTPDE